MADPTATQRPSAAPLTMICAVRAIQAASPTDVPPNFMTRSRVFISVRTPKSCLDAGKGPVPLIVRGSARSAGRQKLGMCVVFVLSKSQDAEIQARRNGFRVQLLRTRRELRATSVVGYRAVAALWAFIAWDMLSKSSPPIFETYWHRWQDCSCLSRRA